MLLKTQESNAPEAVRVDANLSVSFKTKNGEFVIYNRETKQKTTSKSIKMIGINDERFTIKMGESVPGQFVFSGIYRSAKQTINILKSANGKTESIMKGTWANIKDSAKAAGLKYTKLVYALVENNGSFDKAVIELQGISAIQFGKLGELSPVQEIVCSENKTFESGGKFFYEMQLGTGSELSDDTLAQAYLQEVKASFKSEDERYEFYKDSDEVGNVPSEHELGTSGGEEDIDPEDIPF
jgi:hypothetical protein